MSVRIRWSQKWPSPISLIFSDIIGDYEKENIVTFFSWTSVFLDLLRSVNWLLGDFEPFHNDNCRNCGPYTMEVLLKDKGVFNISFSLYICLSYFHTYIKKIWVQTFVKLCPLHFIYTYMIFSVYERIPMGPTIFQEI